MTEAARPKDVTAHGDVLDPGPGSADVQAEGKPLWRAVADIHDCKSVPADTVEICFLGSMTVLINGSMATREGDKLTGAGTPNTITGGASTVHIGDIGFGLANTFNQQEFCRDLCDIRRRWATMTSDQRKDALKTAINKQLGKSGVPAVDINPTTFAQADTMGEFSYSNWRLDVDSNLLNKPSLSISDMRELGSTVYHEARHAEQWFGMAQHAAAAPGATGQTISTSMGIQQNIANVAITSRAAGHSHYSPVFGETMHRSVYGTQRAYRDQIINTINQSSQVSQTTDDQYRALPEETDAWRTEDMMSRCVC